MLRTLVALSALTLTAAISTPVAAQSATDFYKGKTVSFGVGYEPSGGFDAYTRAAARYIGKHIPGNPNVIVINMPGASGLTYVRFIRNQAPKDGTQFGMFDRGLIAKSVMDPKGMGVDFRDFTWIGSMNSEVPVCVLWNTKNIKSVEDVQKYQGDVVMAGTSKNGGGYVYSSLLQKFSPKNVKQIFGYTSTGPMLLAAERGEADGTCTPYGSLQTSYPDLLSQKKLNVVVQFARTRHPDLPDVRTAYEVARTEGEKDVIAFLTAAEAIARPVIAPPGLPAERTALLRTAFMETMKDPEFLEFTAKAKMDIAPVDGEQASRIVSEIAATPPQAVDLARDLTQ